MLVEKKRSISAAILMACGSLLAFSAQAQSDYEVPRTEWGQPDLQGVWNFSSNTPMQRPTRYGTQEFLTQEQIDMLASRIRDEVNAIHNTGSGTTFVKRE